MAEVFFISVLPPDSASTDEQGGDTRKNNSHSSSLYTSNFLTHEFAKTVVKQLTSIFRCLSNT